MSSNSYPLEAMAGSPARASSVSSSHTEAEGYDHNEKNGSAAPSEDSFVKLTPPDELDIDDDVERAGLLPQDDQEKPAAPQDTRKSSAIWMVVNTLATIGIVFTNKAIFSDPSLKLAQLTFAAFHFFITWLTLFTISRPRFAFFATKRVAIKQIIPLAIAMSLNVILPNLSLAFSTVTFYQIARILLTPVVAIMNFVLYKQTVPRPAIFALVPACIGVGVVSYYDSLPSADASVKTTSSLGVIFAFSGIFASSLYTVWVASYHKKLQMNSMQLLCNQAPLAAFMLLYVIPFVDTFPTWTKVPINRWVLIMMSGFFACLINISQFFIINQTGPVSSTVVGHVKTITIVLVGWFTSGRAVGDKSIIGVFIAIGGAIAYSVVMLKHNNQLPNFDQLPNLGRLAGRFGK